MLYSGVEIKSPSTTNDDNIANPIIVKTTMTNNILIVLCLIFLSNVWTLFLTGIPLLFSIGPYNYYKDHSNWYTGDDFIRFLEPVGGLLINSTILYKSNIFSIPLKGSDMICVYVFLFGSTLYLQGSAFHAAANMFKNCLETIQNDHDDKYNDLHYYMRTVWEHEVGHYLYAIGLAIMIACYTYAYRHPINDSLRMNEIIISIISAIVFALLVAGVAIQFPSGTIVGLIYIILYGYGIIGGYLYYQYNVQSDKRALTQYGSYPILHYFLVGYTIALIIIILWVIIVGGFKSRAQA